MPHKQIVVLAIKTRYFNIFLIIGDRQKDKCTSTHVVEIPAVMEALRNQGLKEAYVNIFGNIYKYSTATLVLQKKN